MLVYVQSACFLICFCCFSCRVSQQKVRDSSYSATFERERFLCKFYQSPSGVLFLFTYATLLLASCSCISLAKIILQHAFIKEVVKFDQKTAFFE